MLLKVLLVTFFQLLQLTIQQDECVQPSNYSDFTLLNINGAIYLTGGSATTLQVWSLSLTNGLNTTEPQCWTSWTNNIDQFTPFTHGVGFKISDTSFAVQAGDHGSSIMSQLAYFDLETDVWSAANGLVGQQPSSRARMTASLNQTSKKAYFYGGRTGFNQEKTYFNQFYHFDIDSSTWHWPDVYYSGGQRPARYGHTSSLISQRLFIMGGKIAISSADAGWIVNPADFQSVLVYDTVQQQSVSMATLGDIPDARFSFSAVEAPDGKSIIVFGGQNVSSQGTFDAFNDIYVLDTCTLNWSQPQINGNPPSPRAGHEAFVYNNRYMVVLMGIVGYTNEPIYTNDIAILDLVSWTWVSYLDPTAVSQPSMASCRFTFPVIRDGNGDDDNNNNQPLDTTVISNNGSSSFTTKLALGITFGILGFLLISTAIGIFLFKIRKDVDPHKNPRWLPKLLKKPPSTTSSTEQQA